MMAHELRQKFLEFFKEKGHAVISSAPLIPENDPSVLFTTAGMHPLVPYLLGQSHPLGKRLVDAQKCIRTTDIEDVGDNRHLTFFEMLGNWSLGDYFKKEAIEWSWEFLTDKKYLGLDPKRLYVTVFMGDKNAPIDQESIDAWQKQFSKVGMNAEVCNYNELIAGNENFRIFPLPAKDNWWGPAGETGPCGPCSEMFYDVAPEIGPLKKTFDEEVDDFRIMEIWNDVFMEFNKTAQGSFEKLSQQNVDTGMGLERTISVLNGKKDSFDNELFCPLFNKLEELSGLKYGDKSDSEYIKEGLQCWVDTRKYFRIAADHIKAATFILAEGLEPSNVERGYILRRLIRRAVRYGKQLGINEIFTFKIANVVIEMYRDVYRELHENRTFIEEQLVREEERFLKTLERGLYVLNRRLEAQVGVKGQPYVPQEVRIIRGPGNIEMWDHVPHIITGKWLFDFYQTFGFPLELIIEELKAKGYPFTPLDIKKIYDGFKEAMIAHQELSRAGAEQKFKGGLADHSEIVTKYHTATHLLLAALKQVLGEQVFQKGSNITAERLRFDFPNAQKLTPEELNKVEDIVNDAIKRDLPVKMQEMSLEEAKALGAVGTFESRYGDKVKVYTIGENDKLYSREICGGPHAERTGILGHFKIIKEEAVSAGVRRIKAVLEN